MTPPSQQELFAAKPQPVRRRTVPPSPRTPKWTKYSQKSAKKPHMCDACMLSNHELRMGGFDFKDIPWPRRARYRRDDGHNVTYLCAEHGNQQRQVDGLAKLKH